MTDGGAAGRYETAIAINEAGTVLAGYAGSGTDTAGRTLRRAATWACS